MTTIGRKGERAVNESPNAGDDAIQNNPAVEPHEANLVS